MLKIIPGSLNGYDRNRFYCIAKGSAMECGALLDVCQIMNIVPAASFDRGKDLLRQIIAILTSVVQGKGKDQD